MRFWAIAVFFQATLCSVGTLSAQQTSGAPFETLSVSANMDIYRAGGYNDSSDGVAPFVYTFAARPNQVLEFIKVVGTWTCNDPENVPYGADGTSISGPCYPRANISPTGPFSGYDNTDYQGAMVGMFLEDGLPLSVAPTLRFFVNDNSQGGIKTDFTVLYPLIGQVFFVGDGLTGSGDGVRQKFVVPATATRLYLGYVDSSYQGTTPPSGFVDNGGAMSATLQITHFSK